jgi:signal transduction histidine kinase/ActR/RegA family two-component response regulator
MEAQLAVGIVLGLLVFLILYGALLLKRPLLKGRRLGQRAQESLGVLQTFYEHAPSLLGVVEISGSDIYHVYDNPAACRFFGVITGQTRGRLESDLGAPRQQTDLWLRNLQASLTRRAPLRFEFRGTDSRWFAVTVCPVTEGAGTTQQFCYLAEDISEWKNNAELASIDRQRLQFALTAAHMGFWDWNVVSGMFHYGGDWSNLLRLPEEHFVPTLSLWEALVHPDDGLKVMDILRCNLEGKTPEFEVECRIKRGLGDFLWVSMRGRVIERNSLGVAARHVGVVEDINERRQVREQLKVVARQKDEFLATLAHELRNPLAPIRTGLAIINKDPMCEAARQAREMMDRQLAHLVRLIDDLLDISRISLGRLELKKSQITAKQIVDTAVEASAPLIESNQHKLTVLLPEEPILLDGDLTRLAQVVSNLLNNAAKYSPIGGKIDLSVQKLAKSVLFRVSDNGLGIPPEELESIFEMFSQVNQTLERAQGGLGIGLALVRKIVELHNGTVCAESAGVGQGSTFIVQLPCLADGGHVIPGANKREDLPFCLPKKILVVDDNVDSAESLAAFLRMHGHSTRTAHTGPAAIATQTEFEPDIVFLDIGLPGMNGYEVARRARNAPHGGDACLVAITGWGGDKDKENAKAAGFNAHLTKPVDLAAVEALVMSGSAEMEFRG